MKLTFTLCLSLACLAAPALAVPISVKVVGPDNTPLPAATLRWFEVKYTRDAPKDLHEQTGNAGVFAWNWGGDFLDKRPYGERDFLRVRVAAPGMAPQFQSIAQSDTTIALQSARSWSGVVVDAKQQPVAGVTLKLGEVKPPNTAKTAVDSGETATIDVPAQTVVSDAQGRWSFSGLPALGTAQIIVADPRFARQRLFLAIGAGDAAPLVVKPGGVIKGQLLLSDGTPIAGEKVEADYQLDNKTVTDAQGRFTLENVAAGEVYLYIGKSFGMNAETLPPYLLDSFRTVQVEAEKTTDVGEIKAEKGLLLQARVVGADTKAPLPQARFRVGYNRVPNVTGADGILRSRVSPTEAARGFDRAKIESAGYVDYELPLATFKTDGDVADLGTIEMQRGNAIAGTIRLQGVPAGTKAPSISFSRENRYAYVNPEDDGTFASKTLEAGSYNVNINEGGNNWQVVSPRTVSLPAPGEKFAPVEIVLKRLTPVLPVIKSARGRVTDENGQGVAGVTVNATFALENGNTYGGDAATTDEKGDFIIPSEREAIRMEFESAEHPNYVIGGATKIEISTDGIATITGLVAKKRGAIYNGRVVDAGGEAVAKAWVAVVEARDYEPVQTDETGAFALPDVPLTEFTLIAANNRDWARQSVKSNEPGATLKLQTSENGVGSARALEQIIAIKSGVSSDALFAAWETLGAEGVERFLRRNGEPNADVMALFGAELSRRDPAQLLRRAPELLGNSTGEVRENLQAQLAWARAASPDAGERAAANAWLDEQKQVKREINPRSVAQLLQMADVAQRLKRDDSGQWLDYAVAVAAQLVGDGEGNFYLWSRSLGRLGADSIARFVEERSVPEAFQLWSYAVTAMASGGDVAGARAGLARLETLMNDAAMTQAAEEARKNQRYAPAHQLEEARSAVAVALSSTDPVAALALAQKITDVFVRVNAMIGVGKGAQKAGNADIAAQALREASKARIGNVEYFAQAASIGAQVSPQLGAELFAIAKAKALPKNERSSPRQPSIGAWAWYHAPYDAAQSRVLVEREWNWRLPAASKSKDDFISNDKSALYELVRAMSAIDSQRAAEMQAQADAIKTNSYGQTMSQFDIAVVALASAQRQEKSGAISGN